MNATLPRVELSDLRQLIDSPNENPVLYLDPETMQLAVWASALVANPDAEIVTRRELLETLRREDDYGPDGRIAWTDLDEQDHDLLTECFVGSDLVTDAAERLELA